MVERVAGASGRSAFTLLDVAAGTGELPQTVRTLVAPSIDLRVTLLDRRASHLGNSAARKTVGDALALPFCDASFDFVHCCLFVHHLAPNEVLAFAREALRCSRVALLINDLLRDPIHLALAHAGRPIYRSRLTRHDAPASIRQAYTTAEIRRILEQCGAARLEITRHWFYRVAAIAWKDARV